MDDDLPTDFQVIVVGTGMFYFLFSVDTGMMAILSIFFAIRPRSPVTKDAHTYAI